MHPPGAQEPDPLVGRVLDGRYRIERLLGGGGMGRVYDAVQVDLGRRVAVKMLIPELAKNPSILERFRREALAAAVLGHPHIVEVTDLVLPSDGPPFLVMEHLVGEALVDVLTRDGMLTVPRALRITIQLLDALQAAHDAGIVHRDLKPANVFLVALAGGDEMVKLLDFGVAKLRETPGARKLTAVGEMVGTPRFAAPEQLKGGTVDARTDIYGAGVLLYGMLTGKPPFAGPDMDLIRAVLEETPMDPRVVNPAVDPVLASIVARAMAKNPDDRFESARAMMDALGGRRAKGADELDAARPSVAAVAAQGPAKKSAPPPAAEAPERRGPILLVVAAMLAFAVLLATGVGVAGYYFGQASADDDDDDVVPPPPETAAGIAAETEACEQFLETSCACPGEHRNEICERARTSVLSLRRSVQVGATDVATVGTWCSNMLHSDEICAYDDEGAMEPSAEQLTEGVHPGVLGEDDPTRSDGASIDRYGITLVAGRRVELWVESEAFDGYLVLRDPSGRVVAANDDAGSMTEGTNAQIVYYPRTTGEYVVEAGAARPGAFGAYEVLVAFGEPHPSRGDSGRRSARRAPAQGAIAEPWRQEQPVTNDENVRRNDGRPRGPDPWGFGGR
ncbi:MAG: protein kinase [Sandaracinaceae bacterium]|nr:protein kinase [Sandaracinaceae bacterium]